MSINGKDGEPYINISNTILISGYSSHITVHKYIHERIKLTINQFNIENLDDYYLIFKYKKVEIDPFHVNK
jgi:hypothetical protein